MNRDAVALPGLTPDLPLSPAIRAGGLIHVTGMTGARPGGAMPDDPREQFHAAWAKIAAVLKAAGTDLRAVVDVTSYHVEIDDTFPAFEAVLRERLTPPYPAWTAVGVAALRRPGALAEIKVVATDPAG